ncbi:MAG: flagellar filament capping protein FliD [Gammaproteobacteria bacterium]|nr:flagellar filament capping protein FliD [Gammaproteobacteria bacterium]
MPIVASGIGSGLDVNNIVSQLLGLERQPLVDLDRKEAGYQAKLSAYGSIKGALSSLQTAIRSLSDLSKFQTFKATSADTTVYTATGSATAITGNYAIEVVKLAQIHKIASAGQASSTATIGTGTATTLTFDFGTISGGTLGGDGRYTGASYTLNPAQGSKTITIDSTNNTLEGIRNAINAAGIGVSASIVNDGTASAPARLVLSSGSSGVANSLRIAVSGDAALASLLAYDPEGAQNPVQTVAAQDAELNVDGISGIKKSSNTITDVIQGVTLNLVKPSATGVAASLVVTRDTAAVKTSVENFVKSYNSVQQTLTGLTEFNASTKRSSILQGDAGARSIQQQLRASLNSAVQFVDGEYTLLSHIGVSFQKDGSLSIDAVKLQSAIESNFNDVASLFAALGKASDSLVSYVSGNSKTKPGSYDVALTTLATRGLYNAAATPAFPITIDADNNNFSVKIDGVSSGTISLAQNSYATAAALAAEIQAKINGDSALAAAGRTVTVTHDGTNFVVTSNRYGSVSKVEFSTVDTNTSATIGFSVGAGAAGVDVAGTINGVAAGGSGQFLTGVVGDDSEGLRLQIIGGSTGSRGTVNYSQGYAYQLDKLAANLLGENGAVSSRTDGINSSIRDIASQREAFNLRLVGVERRLRAQFTSLDLAISRLKSTGDFLTQQLAQLQNLK